MSLEKPVAGDSCPWRFMSLEIHVARYSCRWRNVSWEKRVLRETCLERNMSWEKRVLRETCLERNVSWEKRVLRETCLERLIKYHAVYHRSDIKCKRTDANHPVVIHFNQPGHTLDHFKVTGIERCLNKPDLHRLNRENYWQHQLRTFKPLGLNIKKSTSP